MSTEGTPDGYEIVFQKDDDDLIESILAKYSLEHLRQWAWGILSTPASDMPLMVAEDPSVLHVVAAYVRALEADDPRIDAIKTAKRGEP